MADWSASQYLRFADERTRPARDLLAQVPLEDPAAVVDLGCGPGNSTELLAARWPNAAVSGLDTSPDMLREARRRLPGLLFEQGDAEAWAPEAPVDVIFANAVLQWLPGHPALLVRLMGYLAPGGVLAVQMPDNLAEPTHRLMRETAAAMPFADRLAGAARLPLPSPAHYFGLLRPHAASVDIWHTIYNHPMASAEAIVEWVAATGLRPFLDPLDDGQRKQFLRRYLDAIDAAYPSAADGIRLLRFPRLFIVATRA